MLFLATNFWSTFWAVLGGGAALTVLLTLLVATVPGTRRRRQPTARPEVAYHREYAGV